MRPFVRCAALAGALALAACQAIVTPAAVPEAEASRLATEGECVAATPGNRLPFFRCRGDYGAFE